MIVLGLTDDQAETLVNVLEDWTLMTDGDSEIDVIIDVIKEKLYE